MRCGGCSFSVDHVDKAGLCHDCAHELLRDPELTVADLAVIIMPGPAVVDDVPPNAGSES